VCATALKRACRKLGVKHWPYRDQQGHTQRTLGATLGTSAARSDRWPAREASAKRWQKEKRKINCFFGCGCSVSSV
jgi:hypothetical protein